MGVLCCLLDQHAIACICKCRQIVLLHQFVLAQYGGGGQRLPFISLVVLLQEEKEGEPPAKNKYAVRPPRDLSSKFEVRMAEKEKGKMEEIKRRQREEEQAAQAVSALD